MSSVEWEMEFNMKWLYEMDYLFGGNIAFASRLAANDAAANASLVVFESTKNQLLALQALQAAPGRKKRFVYFFFCYLEVLWCEK